VYLHSESGIVPPGAQPVPEHTLILLRHAKSDWSGGEADLFRPLAKRGRRQAAEAGRWLAASIGALDLAIVSPAQRARSTWKIASAELDASPPTRFDNGVYAASGNALLGRVRELSDDLDTVLVVGHNPGLEDLASTLTGHWVTMPTSGLVVTAVPRPWSSAGPSSAELRASGRPPTTRPTR
jgi:phosphohistidine phosphatase